MSWFQKPTTSASSDTVKAPGSLYELRARGIVAAPPEHREPVATIDIATGRTIEAHPGWERRVGGWRPFDSLYDFTGRYRGWR